MIKHLKAKNHKAITTAEINNLGKINVLCGRNNSGKTSVFEALSTDNLYAIGKTTTDVSHIISLFEKWIEKRNYKEHIIQAGKVWFSSQIQQFADDQVVWFSDDTAAIKMQLVESMKGTQLDRYDTNNLFELNQFLEAFFSRAISPYQPLLVPPKRRLEAIVPLDFNQEMKANGDGILNRLFFLKNQDLRSDDHTKFLKIYNLFQNITDLSFNIFPDNQNNLTLFYGSDGEWIAGDDSGLGLSDILIILTLVIDTNASFIFIEEPENHLHANYQKRLLNVLKSTKGRQFFLSTHSSIFLDIASVDRIFHVQINGEVTVSDQTSKSQIIADLGYSVAENLVSDAIVLTEGPTDIEVIRQILGWVGLTERFNIRFWSLGGDIMQHQDVSVFGETHNVFAIIDNDPGSSKSRTRFVRECKKNSIPCIRLERYSIENYATLSALRKVFPRQIPTAIKHIDPAKKVDDQLRFSERGKSIKPKIGRVFAEMSIEDIQETDLLNFVFEIDAALKNQFDVKETTEA